MENTRKGDLLVLEMVIKVTSIIVTFLSTVVKAFDLVFRYKDRHQKSNRHSTKS